MIEKIKRAIVLTQQGDFKNAEQIYMELLKNNPQNEVLLSTIGLFYVNTNDYSNAIKYLEKACSIKETLGTLSALGFAKLEQKEYFEAVKYLEKSLQYGENEDILQKLILCLFEIKSYKKAVKYSSKMYDLYPNNINSISNKIKALTYTGELLEAEKLCVTSLKNNPEQAILWIQLGYLKELIYSDDKMACECFKASFDLGYKEAEYNIATSYHKLREYDKAEIYYKNYLTKNPNNINVRTSLGLCYLAQKKFKEGYPLFFNRNKEKYKNLSKNFYKEGDSLENDIVIIGDQGFGDQIQFIRYVNLLKDKNIKIGCSKVLRPLFSTNFPNIEFIDYTEINPQTQCIFMSDLPYILNINFDNIPYSEGYLNINTEKIPSKNLKVGLCWEAGNAGIRTMINRTININCFEKLIHLEGIEIYSLQYEDSFDGNNKYPRMINLAKNFKDFYDTAKAIKSLDIIVTVDTAVAHLSGALGKKTYLLLPYSSDWRWFDSEKITPWYDSIEIIKQKDSIAWENEINLIIQKINAQK